jgi:hypothetical protein
MEATHMTEKKMSTEEGWTYLYNSPKWHYFEKDGRSLCKRWMTFTKEFEIGNDDSADNCAACKKALAKRKAKESKAQ